MTTRHYLYRLSSKSQVYKSCADKASELDRSSNPATFHYDASTLKTEWKCVICSKLYLHISARGLWLFMGTLTVWLFTSGAQLIMGLDIYYRSESTSHRRFFGPYVSMGK
jgi:hypothetical protein